MKNVTISFAAAVVVATGALLSLGATAPNPASDGMQRINTGELAKVEFKGHVLSDVRSVDAVLYCPSEADNPSFRAAVSTWLSGAPVDYFDSRYATPDLALLEEYCCVMTWANYAYYDPIAMGDVLADYVDGGGKVILGQWTLQSDQSNWLQGRIMTAAYCPVTSMSTSYASGAYAGDGTDCVHTTGPVTTYDTSYLDTIAAVTGTAVSDGTWIETGTQAVVWRPDRAVYYSTGNTGTDLTLTGPNDWAQLTANMCTCGGECPEDVNGDGVVDVLDLLAVLAAWGPC